MAVSPWQDSAQNDLPTINRDSWEAIVFTLRRWMCFVSDGNIKFVGRYLRETRT